jgi:DNA-binding CsgD family transcriptional regulator
VCGAPLHLLAVTREQLSLAEAVESYLFNSQIVTLPDETLAMVCPEECRAHERVRDVLAGFEAQARHTGGPWALATAARCRGMLAAEDDFDAPFAEALGASDLVQSPFERARTHLRYGERLRRSKRLSEAKGPLGSALETFERLAAAPWAKRARHELAAIGERKRVRRTTGLQDLTSQELQIAMAVGAGATNDETAAALFLSPKTVEFHLGKVYRKLGLRSRTELAGVVASDGQPDAFAASRVNGKQAVEKIARHGVFLLAVGTWLRDKAFGLAGSESAAPVMGLLDDLSSLS